MLEGVLLQLVQVVAPQGQKPYNKGCEGNGRKMKEGEDRREGTNGTKGGDGEMMERDEQKRKVERERGKGKGESLN